MSNPAFFEGITSPASPAEKWLADYYALLDAEVTEATTRLAETTDDNEKDQQREFLKLREIAEARLEHLDELAILCNSHFRVDLIIDKLGKHIETLYEQMTSQSVRLDDEAHSMPAFEEEKLRAKVVDTLSLRGVIERQ